MTPTRILSGQNSTASQPNPTASIRHEATTKNIAIGFMRRTISGPAKRRMKAATATRRRYGNIDWARTMVSGMLTIERRVWKVMMPAISGASPPIARARV